MKDKIGFIETKEKRYPICFNFNVMEEMQEKYGSITEWGNIVENGISSEPKIKELKDGLLMMINEAIDMQNDKVDDDKKEALLNDKQVGRIITEVGFQAIVNSIMSLSKESTETEDEKNV